MKVRRRRDATSPSELHTGPESFIWDIRHFRTFRVSKESV